MRRAPRTFIPRVVFVSSGDAELVFFDADIRAMLERVSAIHSSEQIERALLHIADIVAARSRNASTHHCIHGEQPAYRLSKAALNAYARAKAAAEQSGSHRVSFVVVCPGDVDTPMQDLHAPRVLSCDEAARAMLPVLHPDRVPQNGVFLRFGNIIPW